jgi:hypothetical protein
MARLINAKAIQAIMKQRTAVPDSVAGGKKILLTIQGSGTKIQLVDKNGITVANDDGEVIDKMIYNLRANSEVAMKNPANREFLMAGIRAEKAGEMEEADKQFSTYLNKVQMSFSLLLPSAVAGKLADGVEISARVEKITTDNGSLLTIDPKSISIVEPEVLGKTTFNLDDIFASMDVEEDQTGGEGAKPAVSLEA